MSIYEIGATAATAQGYGSGINTNPVSDDAGGTLTNGQLLGQAVTCSQTPGDPNCMVNGTTLNPGQWLVPSPSACTNSGDEIYLVASGGEPVGSMTANTALVMTSVGGPCSEQFTYLWNIDEVSTVATEYALEGFSTDYQHVGTSASNTVGLVNAFATVPNLVNITTTTQYNTMTGNAYVNTPAYPAPSASFPTNEPPDVFSSIVPQDAIDTLANILANCVNVTDGAGDTQCTTLFSYTGGANSVPVGQFGTQGPVASNTADAALYIAHNPGLPSNSGGILNTNVAAVWALNPPTGAPFGPWLTAAPNDFTLTVQFIGGGLGGSALTSAAGAMQMAIDTSGGVWIVDGRPDALTYLNNQGAPQSPETQVSGTTLVSHGGYTGFLAAPGRLDTDQNGNVWIADATDCLWEWNPTSKSSTAFSTSCPSGTPQTVTVDGGNNIWVGGTSFITSLNNPPTGTPRTGFPVTSGFDVLSTFLQPDEAGNVWWTDEGNYNGGFVSSTGSVTTPYTGSFGGGPGSFAAFGTMSHGLALWVAMPSTDQIYPVPVVGTLTDGTYNLFSTTTGVIDEMQTDGNDHFWWDNQAGGSSPANIAEYLSSSTQASTETTGFEGGSSTGPSSVVLDVPTAFVIDQAGNGWVLNTSNYNALYKVGPYGAYYKGNGSSDSSVTEFIGLAAPSQPVNSLNAEKSTYGAKP